MVNILQNLYFISLQIVTLPFKVFDIGLCWEIYFNKDYDYNIKNLNSRTFWNSIL